MDKPSYVFGRDDEWAAISGFVARPATGLQLGVVSGRRRQGKTLLLSALSQAAEGFMFSAPQATEADALRMLGEAYARHTGSPAPYAFGTWDQALDAILPQDATAGRSGAPVAPALVVLDEFPYLAAASPVLPSLLQHRVDRARHTALADGGRGAAQHLILCGSALSFMGGLLSGAAPLRGRAGLELVVPTLDYRDAAAFWGLEDPRLAVQVYAIVGGTPAYRREFVADDSPRDAGDFDDWVCRTVLNPRTPLFREARYLLAEEPGIRDEALYHSVLAAIAEGNGTRGGIAGAIGRKSGDIGHTMSVLQDAGLVRRVDDMLARNRTVFRIAEPLIAYYHAVMRPIWAELEEAGRIRGRTAALWAGSRRRFDSGIVGPAFEEICRVWAGRYAEPSVFARPGPVPAYAQVGSCVVNDSAQRTNHEVDVLVLAPQDGGRRRVLSIGEVKWGTRMGLPHLERLLRVRDLLAARTDLDAADALPACYGGAGFSDELRAEAAAGRVLLVDPETIYGRA